MSEIAWAVSTGEYSDYNVMCVCDTKERAETIAATYNGDSSYESARVEAFRLISSDPQRVTLHRRSVILYDDGTVRDERHWLSMCWDFELDPIDDGPVRWRWVRAPIYQGKGGRLNVWGTDGERVARVFSDRRAQLLANHAYAAKMEWTGSR